MVVILSRPAPVDPTPPALVVIRIHDSLVIEPVATDGYSSAREAASLVHPILGQPESDITIRPAKMRTGTLTFWFEDEQESRNAETAHAEGGAFTLMYTDRPTIEMSYVPTGSIARSLDRSAAWVLAVDYTEIS